jgi:hypothetical protein
MQLINQMPENKHLHRQTCFAPLKTLLNFGVVRVHTHHGGGNFTGNRLYRAVVLTYLCELKKE